MNIVVIGNSVGLRIRPPINKREKLHFCELLKERIKNLNIKNRCKSGVLIDDLINEEIDYIAGNSPDIVVIICGINEAVTRPLPKKIYQYLNKQYYYSSNIGKIFQKVNSGFNNYIFPHLMRLTSMRSWYSAELFVERLHLLINLIQKETKSIVIPITLIPCTWRIEKILPGSSASINKFNTQIKRVLSDVVDVKILKIDEFVIKGKEEDFVPDGIHMNSKTHKLLADQLIGLIQENPQLKKRLL